MNTSKTLWIIMLSGFLAIAIPATAQPDHTAVLKLVEEIAEAPEHHEAIAEYYQSMADNAKSEAEKHEKMQNAYKHSHAKMKGRPVTTSADKHCKRLVELNQSLAKEYEALAELHKNAVNQ